MTALTEYQRLECTGLWRPDPQAQRREVVVSFGDATLMMADVRSLQPLAHWSLPATRRRNPGAMPAIYSPDDAAGEELEIADDTMVAAIAKVHAIIAARQPHPGRLRRALLGTVLAGVVGLGVLVLPSGIVEHTASVIPVAKRAEIGRTILADVTRLTGQPCNGSEGAAALDRLRDRVLGAAGGTLVILPQGLDGTRHLPGRIVLVGAPLLADAKGADGLAEAVLAERLRSEAADPLVAALHWAGLHATFRLLTTGSLPDGALRGYGESLLSQAQPPVDGGMLAVRSEEAGLAAHAGAAGASADKAPPPPPVLTDNDWVALQGICGG